MPAVSPANTLGQSDALFASTVAVADYDGDGNRDASDIQFLKRGKGVHQFLDQLRGRYTG